MPAALICHRPTLDKSINEFRWWADAAEAHEAMQQLAPCGRLCVRVHTIVWRDPTRFNLAVERLSAVLHMTGLPFTSSFLPGS